MYDVVIIMRKTLLGRLAFILFAAVWVIILSNVSNANASNNGLAQKPYMGWSSYSMQVYTNGGSTWITEAQIKAQSDAMHTYLQSHGYDRINIDAAWNSGIDGYGRPVPSAALYPSGFTNLVNYVHANGQKIGLYMIPGMSKDAYNNNLPIYGTACHMQDIAVLPLTTADYWNIGYKIDFGEKRLSLTLLRAARISACRIRPL
jgi:alpha-galactosidase